VSIAFITSRTKKIEMIKTFKASMIPHKNDVHFSDVFNRFRFFFDADVDEIKALVPLSITYGLLTLAVPLGVQVLVNRILSTAVLGQSLGVVLLVSIGVACASFLRIQQRRIVEKIQRRFHSQIVLSASRSLFDGSSEKISHLYFDTFIVQKSISSLLTEGLSVFMRLFFALVLLAFYHPFFLAFDLLMLVSLLAIVVWPLSILLYTATSESKSKHKVGAFLADAKNEANLDKQLHRADEVALDYLSARTKHFTFVIAQMIGLSGLHVLGNALLLGFGAYFVIKEQMSLGQLVAAELVFSAAFSSVEKLNKHLEVFYDLFASVDKLSLIFKSDKEII
jgi:putative ABC transport system ATP-binding protein